MLNKQFNCWHILYLFRKALMPRTSLDVVAVVADNTLRCQQFAPCKWNCACSRDARIHQSRTVASQQSRPEPSWLQDLRFGARTQCASHRPTTWTNWSCDWLRRGQDCSSALSTKPSTSSKYIQLYFTVKNGSKKRNKKRKNICNTVRVSQHLADIRRHR